MGNYKNRKVDTVVLLTSGLVGVTMLTGFSLLSNHVLADNDTATDDVAVTIPVSCMMETHVDAVHEATIDPNTYSGASGSMYENGIGKTTLTTYCNDFNGFSIYAIGYTGNSYDSENHTKLVGTSASGNATIATKVYASGDTDSNWSMKVTKVTDSTVSYNPTNMSITNSFDSWHVVPSTYTQVAEYKASTGSSTTDSGVGALGAKVETTYAAYISPTQPADTYTGQVKYTMVHPYSESAPFVPSAVACQAGRVCYNTNAPAGEVDGTMGSQTVTSNSTLTLYASNYSRSGYGFAGWSDKHNYTTNTQASLYGPSETIRAPSDANTNGLSLYAVWIKSEGYLQDSEKVAMLCGEGPGALTQAPVSGTASLSSVTALTDERDGQTYAIAKLADGNCWMIENLRLDNTAAHNTDGSLAQGYGPGFIGLANPETGKYSDYNIANSLYSVDGSTVGVISGSNASTRFPRYNNFNISDRAIDTTNKNENTYSYGNYYTWAAAIADTSYYSSGDYGTTSICPSGWRLPAGGAGSVGFGALASALNTTSFDELRVYPNNFLYSGCHCIDSSVAYRGGYSYYWTSTAINSGGAYSMAYHNNRLYSGTDNISKYNGLSIRCVAVE